MGGSIGSKTYKIDGFIERSKAKFGERFNYSKSVYINAKSPIIVTCKIHGDLHTTADLHLKSVFGCKECQYKLRRKPDCLKSPPKRKFDKQQILSKLKYKFPHEEFTILTSEGLNSLVQHICLKHNNETQITALSMSLRKYPCTKCKKEGFSNKQTKDYNHTLKQFIKKHKNKYIYPESNKDSYENKNSIIDIICSEHGLFKKKAQKHLTGQGCFRCRVEELIKDGRLSGGYDINFFSKESNKSLKGYIYYIKIGNYYKIGISKNLKARLKSLKSLFKSDYELLDSEETTLYEAWLIEQNILEDFKEYRVFSKQSSEIFNVNILEGIELKSFLGDI